MEKCIRNSEEGVLESDTESVSCASVTETIYVTEAQPYTSWVTGHNKITQKYNIDFSLNPAWISISRKHALNDELGGVINFRGKKYMAVSSVLYCQISLFFTNIAPFSTFYEEKDLRLPFS